MPLEKGLGLHFSFENHTTPPPPPQLEFTLNTNERSVLSLLEIGAVIMENHWVNAYLNLYQKVHLLSLAEIGPVILEKTMLRTDGRRTEKPDT